MSNAIRFVCPRCGCKLKLDMTKYPSMELFVLASPPRPLIAIMYCEKCGRAYHINPADLTLPERSFDTLCTTCIYGKVTCNEIKCIKFNRVFSKRDKIVKCDYYVRKEVKKTFGASTIIRKLIKFMVQRCIQS